MSNYHTDTLTGKMVQRLLSGLGAGFFVFLVLYFGSMYLLDQYFLETGYNYYTEIDRAKELQSYVNENKIAATDSVKLRTWAKERNIEEFTVSRERLLLFDLSYEGEIFPEGNRVNDYTWRAYHWVNFQDGKAEVYLYEGASEKYYDILLGISIVAGLAVCLGIFAAGMQEDVAYIRCLEKEVGVITKGNLMNCVTVKGKDELAQLAYGLDQMRLELLQREKTEQEMRLAQERLVLGMSHDLRTPLTGLLTYLEIIRKQEKEGKISQEYITKAFDKVQQIRRLSDQTFEYFLIHSQKALTMESTEDVESAFGDYLSEMCALLECDGFQVDAEELEWKSVRVQINTDYLGRIVNNIMSNLKKYGDKTYKVKIKMIYDSDRVGIFVKNAIASGDQYVKSTGLGVKNIISMMEQMNGKAEVNVSEDSYCMILYFPISGE